ncbi:hypothetical protein GJ496_006966 [Pomphorhynchus laevis]|nr:hypothetical protein GJ496_006966 [Pomphorhynchus laevis]
MVVVLGTGAESVVITGGSGLIGRAIHDILLNSSDDSAWLKRCTFHFLSSSDCDLTQPHEEDTLCHFLLKRLNPTTVIHLAAHVGGLYRNLKANYTFLHRNIRINDNVVDACVQLRVPRLVACLSTCVFPDQISLPLTADKLHSGEPHSSNYGYAYAKRLLHLQCLAARQQYGLDYVCIVPTNVFGPHDNFNENDGHVIPGLIHRCHRVKQADEPDFVVWGSGKPRRQFIYSRDLAELILWTMEKYNEPEPLILSPSEEYSIGDVAQQIADIMEFKKPIKFDTSKADGQFQKTASNEKLMSLYPTFKFTPFNEALKNTCNWFEENIRYARIW